MLSGLAVKATIRVKDEAPVEVKWAYGALALLSYLQQALPGAEVVGTGTKGATFKPTTAPTWFGSAKVKHGGERFPLIESKKAWFTVGGRYVAVDPVNLYASDHGTDGARAVYDDPTYPDFKRFVQEWKGASRDNTDARLTNMLRDVLSGKVVPSMPAFLPVLGGALFVSEVARNHTAFHTNLMALDLIQKGAKLPAGGGTIDWSWENAIWIEDACAGCGASGSVSCGACGGAGQVHVDCRDCRGTGAFRAGIKCRDCDGTGFFRRDVRCRTCASSGWFKRPVDCRTCGGTGDARAQCRTCRGTGALGCADCAGKGRGTLFDEFRPKGVSGGVDRVVVSGGGAQALQNGLLPMSHKGSAFGSAFNLAGEGVYTTLKGGKDRLDRAPSALLVVRRKEATVYIHWLHIVLGGSVVWDDKTTVDITTSLVTSDVDTSTVDFTTVYDEVTAVGTGAGTLSEPRAVGSLSDQVKDYVRGLIARYTQIRVETLWYAFEESGR